jgi:hypothetical protein
MNFELKERDGNRDSMLKGNTLKFRVYCLESVTTTWRM